MRGAAPLGASPPAGTLHCGNYAVYVLRRLGVLPAETPLDCVLPSSIMAMSGRHGVLHRIDK